jgi:hypothetical protein
MIPIGGLFYFIGGHMFKRVLLADEEKWIVSWKLYDPSLKSPLMVLDKRTNLKYYNDYYVIWNPSRAGILGQGCNHYPVN